MDLCWTHILFVDDILLFTNGLVDEGNALQEIPRLYCESIQMEMHVYKSILCFNRLGDRVEHKLITLFELQSLYFNEGF